MPIFEYRATDADGSPQQGRMVARDLASAAQADFAAMIDDLIAGRAGVSNLPGTGRG